MTSTHSPISLFCLSFLLLLHAHTAVAESSSVEEYPATDATTGQPVDWDYIDARLFADEAATPQPVAQAWFLESQLRLGIGYEFNVLRDDENHKYSDLVADPTQDSPFFLAEIEAFALRSSDDNQTRFSAFFSARNQTFSNVEEGDRETQVFLSGTLTRDFTPRWQLSLATHLVYNEEFFDLSSHQGAEFSTPIVSLLQANLTPRLQGRLTDSLYAALRLNGTRSDYDEPEGNVPGEDHYQYGATLELGWEFHPRALLRLEYARQFRVYDERNQLTSNGANLFGRTLEYEDHSFTAFLETSFGRDGQWKFRTRLRHTDRTDNAGGFYNYERYDVAPSIAFEGERWKASLETAWQHYIFHTTRQELALQDGESRTWSLFNTAFHLERRLGHRWSAFFRAETDNATARFYIEGIDEYTFSSFTLGLEFTF